MRYNEHKRNHYGGDRIPAIIEASGISSRPEGLRAAKSAKRVGFEKKILNKEVKEE